MINRIKKNRINILKISISLMIIWFIVGENITPSLILLEYDNKTLYDILTLLISLIFYLLLIGIIYPLASMGYDKYIKNLGNEKIK